MTVIPGRPLPSFQRKRESRTVMVNDAAASASNRWIPAYAGMTVGAAGRTVKGGRVPAYAGMTVGESGKDGQGRPGSRLRGNDSIGKREGR